MKLFRPKSPKLVLLIEYFALALLGVLYFYCLPVTVQGGDTGEMATNPYYFRLTHPPGFPVYFWIQRLFTHAFPFFSLFKRSAFFSLLTALVCFHGLFKNSRPKDFLQIGLTILVVFGFATTHLVWKFSVLPEVFLPLLALSSFTVYYCLEKQFFAATVCWVLALGVHPIALFLAPLWLSGFLKTKTWKGLLAVTLGVTTCYLSLLLIRGTGLYAWTNITSSGEFLRYVLRSDYGTMKLSPEASGFFFFDNLYFFCHRSALFLFPVAITLALAGKSIWRNNRILLLTLAIYLFIFFSLANMSQQFLAGETVARFHLLPLLLAAILAIRALPEIIEKKRKVLLLVVYAVTALCQVVLFFPENNFSQRHVVQEYAENLLRGFHENKECSLLFTKSDAAFVALNYVQSNLGLAPQVKVIANGFLGLESYRQMLSKEGIKFSGADGVPEIISEDILKPNLPRCEIISEYYDNTTDLQVTVLPLGRAISLGNGLHWSHDPVFRPHYEPQPTLFYDIEKRMYARYADFYLAQSIFAINRNQLAVAKSALLQALQVVPDCKFAWIQLCNLERAEGISQPVSCEQSLKSEPYCDPSRP